MVFEEDLVLNLTKLEFPLTKDNLYQVLLNLTSWFWRRYLKNFNAFLFTVISPWRRAIPFI
jgi:hypothetical protein